MEFDTLSVRTEGAVRFVAIDAPPMNLLGPDLVRDLVSLIQEAEADGSVREMVFTSSDPPESAAAFRANWGIAAR